MTVSPVTLSGPVVEPASGNAPRQLVVLLHGLGSDGNDLISLAPMLAEALPDAQFISPNAPEPCDMAPFGYQWFSLQNRAYDAMSRGAAKAAPVLGAFLDQQLRSLGLHDGQMALIGFSQGTMMSLYTALRRPQPCAAIVGFSGALLGGDALPLEVTSRPPVCLVHGDADQVVAYEAMEAAEETLKEVNVPVETYTRPGLGHGIDPEGLSTCIRFLQRHLLTETTGGNT